jgi:hypothetical protein
MRELERSNAFLSDNKTTRRRASNYLHPVAVIEAHGDVANATIPILQAVLAPGSVCALRSTQRCVAVTELYSEPVENTF